MTTLITRLYSDPAAADAAKAALLHIGQDEETIQIITGTTAGGAAAAMKAARLDAGAASTYARAMTADQALLVVQVPFNPIGGARGVLKLLRKHPAMAVGISKEDVYLRDYPTAQFANRVMTNHPLLASNPFRVPSHGHIFGNNPVSHSKDRTSAMKGGGHMSRMFWPMKLVSAPKQRTSAIRGGFLFSSLFGLRLVTNASATPAGLPKILR